MLKCCFHLLRKGTKSFQQREREWLLGWELPVRGWGEALIHGNATQALSTFVQQTEMRHYQPVLGERVIIPLLMGDHLVLFCKTWFDKCPRQPEVIPFAISATCEGSPLLEVVFQVCLESMASTVTLELIICRELRGNVPMTPVPGNPA